MKNFHYTVLISLLALLPACTVEEPDTDPARGAGLTALLEEPDTRVSYDSVLGKHSWDTGDMIAIYAGSAYVSAEVTPSTGHVDYTETASAVRSHYAVYPATSAVAANYGEPTLSVLLPAVIDIQGKGDDYSPMPMVAENDVLDSKLRFRHVGGLLRLTCQRVPAGTMAIKVTLDQPVTGTYTVNNPSSMMPTISSGTGSDHTNAVIFKVSETGLSGETTVVLNVPVPCGTYHSVTVGTYANAAATGTATTEADATGTYVIARRYGIKVPFEDLGDFQLTVVEDPTDVYCYGGTSTTARVASYRLNGASRTAVGWEAYEYYQDAACTVPYGGAGTSATTRPDWLSAISGGGTTADTGASVSITYSASPAAQTTAGTTLPSSSFGTGSSTSNYYNLSNPDDMTSNDIKESANCYIVNGPGYYRIPLILGNAIRNNEIRPNYRRFRGSDGENQCYFKDYMGNGGTDIVNPRLHITRTGSTATANDYTPTSAFVVWEDVNDLIQVKNTTDYTLAGTPISYTYTENDIPGNRTYWLRFHVQGNTKGNAVIAVTDNSRKVMWSWHIWVTDFVPKNYPGYADSRQKDIDVTNHTGIVYRMMPMHLGWVPVGDIHTHDARTVYVKLRQTSGGSGTAVMKVTQAAGTTESDPGKGRAPSYQWGRKDAFWSCGYDNVNATEASALTCYGKVSTLTVVKAAVSLDVAIQNPGTYYGAYPWNSEENSTITTGTGSSAVTKTVHCFNLWSADNQLEFDRNDNEVVKTIYDPSPAGYHIPASNAFSGFTTSGNPESSTDQYRVKGSFDYGWNFYADPEEKTTIFFPVLGERKATAGELTNSSEGHVWMAIPRSHMSGMYFRFDADRVQPSVETGDMYRSMGKNVRPVEED